jgi:FixJ family two-component response regulator
LRIEGLAPPCEGFDSKGAAQLPTPPLIACVDDDPSVREALEGLLRSVRYAARTFASAEEFLRFAGLADVSCLITDMKLGGMSGLQLQRQLRASGLLIPTIVITAFDDEQMRQQSFAAGALGLLRKPIHDAELLALIRQALNLTSSAPKGGPKGAR